MKKILTGVLLMALVLFSAHSEEAPDGSTQTVYFPCFEKEALSGFQYVLYPEKSGLLLSAYSDDMEIAVTVEENPDAESEEEFLRHYLDGIGRYAVLKEEAEILSWRAPDGKEGRKVRIRYRSEKAEESDEGYVTDAYSVRLTGDMYLLLVFNSWAENAGDKVSAAAERFFASFRLEEREVSDVHLAQVKSAREDEDGKQYVSVDFCSVVYDPTVFMVYIQNSEKENQEYTLSPDALVWNYDTDASLYTPVLDAPRALPLTETAAHYYEKRGFDIVYQILFDENNEIIWMMHYNAL